MSRTKSSKSKKYRLISARLPEEVIDLYKDLGKSIANPDGCMSHGIIKAAYDLIELKKKKPSEN